MKEKKYEFNYQVYDSIEELPEEQQKLLNEAREVTSQAYAPYSNFQVGAVAKMANGEIVTGSNQDNAYYTSPVGVLKIQCTDKYLKAVIFYEDNLTEQEDSHKILQSCKKQLDEYFSGKRKSFHLPLNQDGTDFQNKIWNLLTGIGYGRTISYNELAKQYGDIKAIRAVAAANGKNNLAIIVPCHRVIGSDQSLVGYAGGLWRKKWLLDHEASHEYGIQRLF